MYSTAPKQERGLEIRQRQWDKARKTQEGGKWCKERVVQTGRTGNTDQTDISFYTALPVSLSQLRHCHHHVFIFLSVLTIRSCSLSLLEFIPRVQNRTLNLINTFYILKLQILSSNHRLHEFLCNLVEDETCFFSLTCLCTDLQAAAKRQRASWRTFCSCQENPLKWNIEQHWEYTDLSQSVRAKWFLTFALGFVTPWKSLPHSPEITP